ncbi:MAG: hypothetical protein WBG46_06225 [Nonlabens sp.]
MSLFMITVSISFVLSLIAIVSGFKQRKLEKILGRISVLSFIATVICILSLLFDYRLVGRFTNVFIGSSFVISTILYFGLTRYKSLKIITGFFSVTFCVAIIIGFVIELWKFPILIVALPFQPPQARFEVAKQTYIEVRDGGFLACGESLYLTQTAYFLLEKQKYLGNNACVQGISQVNLLSKDSETAKFEIHHNGSRSDIDNPYIFEADFSNIYYPEHEEDQD